MIATANDGFVESELIQFPAVDRWAEGRHQSIGSSDVATILGYGYAGTSVYSLWAEKCHGVTPEFTKETLEYFEIGKINEPYLAKRCEHAFGWKVQHDPPHSFRRNRDRTYLTASLDAWMIEDGQYVAIEFKGINAFSIRSEWDIQSGKAPLKYTIQLQHQLAVTGWKKGYLVALSGLDIYKVEVARHDKLIEQMLLECEDFWRLVQEKKEPEIDESEATYGAINRVYTKRPMEAAHLDDEDSAMVDGLLELEKSIKADQKQLEKYRNQLAAAAKGAEYLVTSDGQMFVWKKRQLKPYGKGR